MFLSSSVLVCSVGDQSIIFQSDDFLNKYLND